MKKIIYTLTAIVLTVILVSISSLPSDVIGAEVAVDTTAFVTNTALMMSSPTSVWLNDTTGFAFYLGVEGDLEMASTTNSGSSWLVTQQVDSVNTTDVVSYGVWWDGWTPGTTTTRYIHVVTVDSGVDDTYYTRIDTTNGSKSTTVLATTQGATCIRDTAMCLPSITRAANGVIYMSAADASDSWVVSCSTTCTTAGNWSERASAFGTVADLGDDSTLLMPIAGTNNVMLIYWDISADTIDFNIYSATSSAWQYTTTQVLSTLADDNVTYAGNLMSASIATTTGMMGFAIVDDANDYVTSDHDIKFWTHSSSTGWAIQANAVTTASGGLTGVRIAFEPKEKAWYAIYSRRTTIGTATTGNIYYRYAYDNANSEWSAESGSINDNADNIGALSVNLTSYSKIGAWWQYTTAPSADQIYYDDVYNIPDNQDFYRFNASDAATNDPNSVWSNDTNGFDSSHISGSSVSTNGSTTLNYLDGEGTNAPTSGDSISQVDVRIYGYNVTSSCTMYGRVSTDGLAETLGTASASFTTTRSWGSNTVLSTPSGGWTWQKVNDLELRLYTPNTSGTSCVATYIEVIVTRGAPSGGGGEVLQVQSEFWF